MPTINIRDKRQVIDYLARDYEWLRDQFATAEARSRLTKVKELARVASDLDTTLPKLALAWCLKNPRVSTVITGASKPKQVRENMKAAEVVGRLTSDVMQRIEKILQNKPKD
jgi:aryl-alcohol dehydrogenase-like predicted oxidoreductase